MIADDATRAAVESLIHATYLAMSTPGSNVREIFGADEIAIAGSGQGELWVGPQEVGEAATAVASWGFRWTAEAITVWRRGEVAWAQILGSVRTRGVDPEELVPYWTTGVFALTDAGWHWLYWGGSEPQESPKI